MDPNFIVIGPGRSGTTFLYQVFQDHPDICMPRHTKEINYFNQEYHRGIEWYRSFFAYCQPNKVRGEISNTYIYDPRVPDRIKETYPGIKLISILRNPFERIVSAYKFRRSVGEIGSRISFDNAIQKYPDLVTDNYYGSQLERYFHLFPKEHILILLFDDLEQSPGIFLDKIFAFLNVSQAQGSHKSFERVNPSRSLRMPFLAPLVRLFADTMRRLSVYKLLDYLKSSTVIARVLFFDNDLSTGEIFHNSVMMSNLKDVFIPEISKVEVLIGMDLSHWYADL